MCNRSPARRRVALAALVLMLAAPATLWGEPAEHYTVASKSFTESVVLGEIARGLIEERGATADHREQLGGTRVCWEALTRDEIDAYSEYTGTIREELFPNVDIDTDEDLRELLAEHGVSMSEPLGFENTYALAMVDERAEQLGVEQISDLTDHSGFTYGFSNEFVERADGWDALREHYGLEAANVHTMEHDLVYPGVEAGELDVVVVYTTEAAIEDHDLRLLEDDRAFFPDYHAVFLYRSELEEQSPQVVEALSRLEGALTESEMAELNRRVRVEGRDETAVASSFLAEAFDVEMGVEVDRRLDRIRARTGEHLFLVAVSMTAAILIAIPLGIWAARQRRVGQGILGVVGILQTIPSLALLVFMIPLFGIGNWPAIAALFLYSLLPIVRNTYAGLKAIPDEILESARALGLPRSAIMRRVELPMAMHSILAGIKISIVINIGVATLGALVGSGGYGQPILTGIRRYDIGLILEGAIPAAALAIAAQLLFEGVERIAIPRGLRQQE